MSGRGRPTKSEIILLGLTAAFLCTLAVLSAQDRQERIPGAVIETEVEVPREEIAPDFPPVDLNTATAEELDTLFADTGDPQVDDTLPRAIMALSRPYREVIILYYYQELKAREIADVLHVDVSTVTARLSRARKQLREALKGWYYDE